MDLKKRYEDDRKLEYSTTENEDINMLKVEMKVILEGKCNLERDAKPLE